MKEKYTSQDVEIYLRRYGEMRFGKPKDAPEDLPFIPLPDTSEGVSFSFSVDEKMNFHINAPSGLCCDWGVLEASPDCPQNAFGEYKFPIERTCFIYDSDHSFLLGVDPKRREIWPLPDPKNSGASINVDNLSRTFPNKDGGKSGIENVSFIIRPAEFVGIYGGSGTGKTTLIERILSPEYHSLGFFARTLQRIKSSISQFFLKKCNKIGGSVKINGNPPEKMVDTIAYLPQSISLPSKLTCQEIFELAAADRGVAKSNFAKFVKRVLDWCVLDDSILQKKCKSLSGGQKRRVALAVALLREKTNLLIVDEPTTGLDPTSEQEIMHTLRTISRSGITVIVVTHSLAYIRLFDRVLMLRKKSPQHGAALAYNQLWHDDALKKYHGMSDIEIFEQFTEPDDVTGLRPDKIYTDWPLDLQEENETKSKFFNLRNILRFGFYPLILAWNLICQVCRRGYHWAEKSTLLNIRSSKRIIYFSLLAALCTIIIQFATIDSSSGTQEGTIRLITLLSLAAPWLCATYATLFVADSIRFFAWEKFSGLKTLSYVLGTMFSMLLPVILISLVFTCGMFCSVSNKGLSMKLLSDFYAYASKHPNYINKSISAKTKSWLGPEKTAEIKDKVKEYSTTCEEVKNKPCEKPKDYNLIRQPVYDLWDDISAGDCSDFKVDPKEMYTDEFKNNQRLIYTLGLFLRTWLIMIIICMCGISIGVVIYSWIRDLPVSILAVVVLFIFFLSFSRLMITDQKGLLGPLSTFTGKIPDSCKIAPLFQGKSIPVLFSFASLGRYTTNSVVYSGWESVFDGWRWLADKVIILIWTLINVILAIGGFANKNKNWKEISR